MKVLQTKIYSFSELSKDAKAKAVESLRDINVDYDNWHDYIIEDYTEKLEALGYRNIKIFYSGFWSQGDGACYTAKVDIYEWLKAHKLSNKYKALFNVSKEGGISATISHSSHYYYSTSTSLEESGIWEESTKVQSQYGEIEKLILAEREQMGNELYRALESAYEEEQKDENVINTIEANEYSFLEDGTRSLHL